MTALGQLLRLRQHLVLGSTPATAPHRSACWAVNQP